MGLKQTIKKITPKPLWRALQNAKQKRIKREFFKTNSGEDFAEECEYIRNCRIVPNFPYNYTKKYYIEADDGRNKSVMGAEVFTDNKNKTVYINQNGKPLYFAYEEAAEASLLYAYLAAEQDPESPHRYISDELNSRIKSGEFDTLIDIGGAEGNLSLELADRLKRIIIVEFEEKWQKPLSLTFAPYKEKTTIIQKFCSDKNDETCVTLDEMTKGIDLSKAIIKMDVEGAEAEVLCGGKNAIENAGCFLVCTYHKEGDKEEFGKLFKEAGYRIEFTEKYLIWDVSYPGIFPPKGFSLKPRTALMRAFNRKYEK
jgi:hypothetical protein